MKKALLIAGALAVASMGTTNAAMKYVDVPSGHWAYDAIEYADSKGCWEGYPDGTFRGNRNITRYEMAMLVMRIGKNCLTIKSDAVAANEEDKKALAETAKLKALIDKLQAEFKDEIAALKTRVKKNEGQIDDLWKDQKRQDKELKKLAGLIGNVKISGTLRSRIDSYGTDLNATNLTGALEADPIVGGAVAAADLLDGLNDQTYASGLDTDYSYEAFYDLQFAAEVGNNVDILVEMNNWASDSRYGSRTGADRTPVIDQAYAAIDFTDKTQSIDNLVVTLGTQYAAFGPHHLMVDNGWQSTPMLRMDLSKDIVDFHGVFGVWNQANGGTIGAVNPINGGAGQDTLSALRLGLNFKPVKIGVNYMSSGIGKEKGWGLDIESPLLRNTNWFNGISGEFYQLSDDQAGGDPDCAVGTVGCANIAGSDDLDKSWMVALDVYKSKKTLFNAYYADMGLATGISGTVADPFSEFNTYTNPTVGTGWSYGLDPFLFDNYHLVAPNFEGFGAKLVHSFANDLTVSAIARKGDVNSAPTLEYPAFSAVRVSKGLNDDTTFAIDYSQYGGDDVYLNRVRGELVVNF